MRRTRWRAGTECRAPQPEVDGRGANAGWRRIRHRSERDAGGYGPGPCDGDDVSCGRSERSGQYRRGAFEIRNACDIAFRLQSPAPVKRVVPGKGWPGTPALSAEPFFLRNLSTAPGVRH